MNIKNTKVIPTENLDVSAGNIRKFASYDDISESLRKGEQIREPLFVYWNQERSKHLIWDGGRRFNGGKDYGLREFHCVVFPNIHTEAEARQASLKHNMETKVISYLEIAIGVKGVLEELLKTMSEADARKKIIKEYAISSGELSRQLNVAEIDPKFILAVSHAKQLNLSARLLYDTSLLSPAIQRELAKYDWHRAPPEQAQNWLRTAVTILRENKEPLKMYGNNKRIEIVADLVNRGFTHTKVKTYIKRKVESDTKAQDLRSHLKEVKKTFMESGGKLPEKVKGNRTLMFGPRVDYLWKANELVATAYGMTLEDHIIRHHLDPEAIEWLRRRSEALGDKPKIRLKDLRSKRKALEKQMEQLDEQIREKELEYASRKGTRQYNSD